MRVPLHRSAGLAWLCGLLWLCLGERAPAETTNAPTVAPRKPCIVLILADGLGYGELGCYGQKKIRTPVLDQLASQGMRFTQYYAGATSEEAARVALLTGNTRRDGLTSGVPTLAEYLKSVGYHTAYIGYWGMGGFTSLNAAHRRGFMETAVYGGRRHANDLYTGHLFRKDSRTGFEKRMALADNNGGQRTMYLPDLLTRAAVEFCKESQPERANQYRPFFLMLSYPVPAALASSRQPIPNSGSYSAAGWTEQQKARADAISRFDAHVGEIITELERRDTAGHTIVLVSSVLGPAAVPGSPEAFFDSLGPLTSDAGPVSEGRLRVPLIVQWPFWMRAGQTSEDLLSAQDIVPTLLEAAQVELPESLPGISFLPLLQGREQTNRHAALRWSADRDGAEQRALRHGKWKLIEDGAAEAVRLYDLAISPGEQDDVSEQHPEVIARMKELMEEHASSAPVTSDAERGSH